MRYCFLCLLLMNLWACHQDNDMNSLRMMDSYSEDFEEILDVPVTHQPPPPPADQADDPALQTEKQLIKNGQLTFKVKDSEQTYQSVLKQIKKQGAYVESEYQSTEYDRKYTRLMIRVESNKFDSLFTSLATQATDVEERGVSIEDVTEVYYDLQARIKNRKALEERYVELLEKAESVKDMVEIEKNLNELRTEIESAEGRFRYLSRQIKYSTIHLNFYELLPYTYSSELRAGFGARLMGSLAKGWEVFLSFLVGLIGLWPFLLLLTGVLLGLRKWRRKRAITAK